MNISTLSRTLGAQFLMVTALLSGALVAPSVQAQEAGEVSADSTLPVEASEFDVAPVASEVASDAADEPVVSAGQTSEMTGSQVKRFDFDIERALKNSWLSINGISYHFDRKNPHNERNWGLGLDIPLSDHSSLLIGRYKNSDWRQSNYAWFVNTPWSLGKVQLGWMAGLATGYRDNPLSPMLVGGLAATIRNDKIGVNVICLPPALCAANLTVKVW